MEVAVCAVLISKVKRVDGGMINKANVRMIYGNPIILMLCTVHKYWYRLEDKMWESEDEDILEKGVSQKST